MPTFITTGRFTLPAIQGLAAMPEDRTEAVKQIVEAAGGKLISYYITTGEADFVLITEGDNGDQIVAGAMAASLSGAISDVKTVRAWTSAEFASVAARAGKIASSYRAPGQG
jgi:uncharacterized protein with GYD domain